MSDEDFTLGLLLEIVRHTALELLERRGALEPYGVKLVGEPTRPVTFIPADEHPGAGQTELLTAILESLRAPSPELVRGVALVVGVDTDEGRHLFAAQIESTSYRLLALFKYWRRPDGGFIIEEPELKNELMVSAGLDWPRPAG